MHKKLEKISLFRKKVEALQKNKTKLQCSLKQTSTHPRPTKCLTKKQKNETSRKVGQSNDAWLGKVQVVQMNATKYVT